MSTFNRELIVILDDDEEDCYLLRKVLERDFPHLGIITLTNSWQVTDQLTALDSLPILVLLDLHMPLRSGLEVLAELRAHPAYVQLPVAVMSTSIYPIDKQQLAEYGVLGYFEKPNSVEQISSALEGLIKRITTHPNP